MEVGLFGADRAVAFPHVGQLAVDLESHPAAMASALVPHRAYILSHSHRRAEKDPLWEFRRTCLRSARRSLPRGLVEGCRFFRALQPGNRQSGAIYRTKLARKAATTTGIEVVPKDSFNREIDLPAHLGDRQLYNLRCIYCMPLEGLRVCAPNSELLSAARELRRFGARFGGEGVGFRKFRSDPEANRPSAPTCSKSSRGTSAVPGVGANSFRNDH